MWAESTLIKADVIKMSRLQKINRFFQKKILYKNQNDVKNEVLTLRWNSSQMNLKLSHPKRTSAKLVGLRITIPLTLLLLLATQQSFLLTRVLS